MKGLALKLRVLQINAVPYGSTGGIMFSLADVLEAKGDCVLCTTGFSWRKMRRCGMWRSIMVPGTAAGKIL